MSVPDNPNLLPVSEADREAAWPFVSFNSDPNPVTKRCWDAGIYDNQRILQAFAAHRLAAEQSKDAAFVAMLEGMKRDVTGSFVSEQARAGLIIGNAVIDEAIANTKALGEGRAG